MEECRNMMKAAQWNSPGWQTTRKLAGLAFAILLVAASTAFAASRFGGDDDRDDDERRSFAIGLWGDLPYSDVQALTGVPNLIADMNRHDLAFTAHDGDLKAGNATVGSVTPTTCSDALYLQGLNYFNSLKAPAIFTPVERWILLTRAPRPRACPLLQHAGLARPASAPSGSSNRSPLSRRKRYGAVRRKPALDPRWRHLRNHQHSGLLQQSLRHGSQPRRIRSSQPGRHSVGAGDLRGSSLPQLRGHHAH